MVSVTLDGISFSTDDMIGTDGKGYAQVQDAATGTNGSYAQEPLFPDRFFNCLLTETETQLGSLSAGFSANSVTSMAVAGAGSISFTATTGKLFSRGLRVRIADSAAPGTNYMEGTVSSYDPVTGAITVARDASAGSGTKTAWDIGLAAIAFSAAIANVFTGQQAFARATLTDAATIAWNLNTQQKAKVTLGANRTLGAPTNMVNGGEYSLIVVQDGTGGRTLAYNAVFKWSGGAPVLSTAIGAIDVLFFESDGTNMYGTYQLNYS